VTSLSRVAWFSFGLLIPLPPRGYPLVKNFTNEFGDPQSLCPPTAAVGTLAAVIVLVLGGTRSGKSELAEQLASRLPAPVSYLATATVGRDGDTDGDIDDDMAARVARHRERRPSDWRTLEVGDPSGALAEALAATSGTVLVDSLGPWLAARPDFDADVEGLCAALRRRPGDTVVVSDEVGLGVHPSTEVGRRFRDALGAVNRSVAAEADRVLLVVAGRALELQPAADVLGR
jgi:adenosyl cobinamide kinase/adenosyl cobinamide phosphate guanylyltransferase